MSAIVKFRKLKPDAYNVYMQGPKNHNTGRLSFKDKRRNGYYAPAVIPYTNVTLVKEICSNKIINDSNFDKDIAVWYCFELAIYLAYIGYNNITLISLRPCERLAEIAMKFGFKYIVSNIEDELNMKFDLIVGNPPYQDGSKQGGQNKIYNQITQKSLVMLKDDGIICFITPTSILKKSKRSALNNTAGLKFVNFTTDRHFDVGINTCYWIVDKTYNGNVTVICNDGEHVTPRGEIIYDYTKVDKDFVKLYTALKEVTNKPDKRMFKLNAVATNTGRSKFKSTEFKYPVYKNETGSEVFVQFNKPKPKLYNKRKIIISITKSFDEDAILVSYKNFNVAHMFTSIDNDVEVENIKSFLFSDYFKEHSQKWKDLDGYGYNYALKYLPPFDKTRSWTNEEVKHFLEGFL